MLKDGTSFDVTPKDAANIAKGYYGDFTDGAKKYKLTTGLYAAGARFGDGNIDKCIYLRTPVVSYADYEEVYVGADYYIEPGSVGVTQSQFGNVVCFDTVNQKQISCAWFDLYTIDLASGSINRGGSIRTGEWQTVGVKINLLTGEMQMYINGVAQEKTFKNTTKVKNAAGKDQTIDITKITLSNSSNSNETSKFIVSKIGKTADVASLKGAVCINNVKMGTPAIIEAGGDSGSGGDTPGTSFFANLDFEDQDVGKEPIGVNLSGLTDTKVVDMNGNKVWQIDFERPNGENKFNIDKQSTISNSAFSYKTMTTVVMEADYFIEASATGQLESQFYKMKYGDDQATASYQSIYTINFEQTSKAGSLILAGESITFPLGQWNTVSVVLDLQTAGYAVYLNGEKLNESTFDRANGKGKITVDAGNWIAHKVNKINGEGTFYLDNFKIFEGTEPSPVVKGKLDFDSFASVGDSAIDRAGFISVPALLSFGQAGGSTALRLGMGSVAKTEDLALYNGTVKTENVLTTKIEKYYSEEQYLVHDGVEYTIYTDAESGLSYIKYLNDEKSLVNYYILPANVVEAANGGANVGKATVVPHSALSYKDSEIAMLEADYFIEEGSTGIVESLFEKLQYDVLDADGTVTETCVASALQLFQINMVTGGLTGQGGTNEGDVFLDMNEWNNIKVMINLKTGVFKIYVNGLLARTYECGYQNLILGADKTYMWSIASVQAHSDVAGSVYEGAIYIDNVYATVKDLPATESTISDRFMSDEALIEYLEGALVQIEKASIRFASPTGLRFATKVKDGRIQFLKSLFGEENVKLGTLITPDVYLEEAAGDSSRAALDAVAKELGKKAAYVDVAFQKYFPGDGVVDLGNGNIMTASIVNIKGANIGRDFAGIGYLEIVIDGTVYGGYTAGTLRSAQGVAADIKLAAGEDFAKIYSADLQAVINAYAAGVQPS